MRKPSLFLSVLIAISGCGEDEDIPEDQKSIAAISATCARACAHAAAAKCADGNVDCMVECRDAIESSPSACDRELEAFTACVTKAKFTCDLKGEAEAKECNAQLVAWANCQETTVAGDTGVPGLPGGDSGTPSTNPDAGAPSTNGDSGTPSTNADSGVPNTPATDGGVAQDAGTNLPGRDAGQNDAGPLGSLTCAPEAGDDACGTCFKASCCDEIQECGADCFALLGCITECETNTCVNTCYTTYPNGVEEFSLMASCMEDSCESECADDIGPTSDAGTPGSDLSQICLPITVPEGTCTDPRQPVGHDCPLGQPYADCTLLPDVANVYCCSR